MIIISAKDEDVLINESETTILSHLKDKAQVVAILNDGKECIVKNVTDVRLVNDTTNWHSLKHDGDGMPGLQWNPIDENKILKR